MVVTAANRAPVCLLLLLLSPSAAYILQSLFDKYGRIVDIALKAGFCFVEFQDERDAADAVYGRDGYDWRGSRLRVEHCKPRGERDVQFGLAPPGGRAPGGYDRSFPSDRPPPKCVSTSGGTQATDIHGKRQSHLNLSFGVFCTL